MYRLISCFLVLIVAIFMGKASFAELSGALDEKSIIERIQPEGKVTVDMTGKPALSLEAKPVADIGQSKYEQICKTCHETGLADAPKFANKEDWKPRIAQGMDTLMKHALQGLKAMPPKGGCSTCTDDEIKKAVEYMVNHSK